MQLHLDLRRLRTAALVGRDERESRRQLVGGTAVIVLLELDVRPVEQSGAPGSEALHARTRAVKHDEHLCLRSRKHGARKTSFNAGLEVSALDGFGELIDVVVRETQGGTRASLHVWRRSAQRRRDEGRQSD